MAGQLYNREILRLAASTAGLKRLDAPMASVERRSPICGSRVVADVVLDDQGHLGEIGLMVRACALGQASAALFAASAQGRTLAEIAEARDALAGWLAGEGAMPDWPGLAIFEPAIPHAARHASIRLPFEAVADAMAEARTRRAA
jgi:NifU-like protein involved in Fe-S cluster formation